MELRFAAPGESGWRGRGAPRKHVPEPIMAALRRARDTGKDGILKQSPDEGEDVVREAMSTLRAGARDLGRRIRIQHDAEAGVIRFRVGGPI